MASAATKLGKEAMVVPAMIGASGHYALRTTTHFPIWLWK